jgi:hypothetical protein
MRRITGSRNTHIVKQLFYKRASNYY